jgi:hypothetical protein
MHETTMNFQRRNREGEVREDPKQNHFPFHSLPLVTCVYMGFQLSCVGGSLSPYRNIESVKDDEDSGEFPRVYYVCVSV